MATLSRLMAAKLVTPSFTEEKPDFEAILTPLPRRQQFDPASYASGDGFGDGQSKPHPLRLRVPPLERLRQAGQQVRGNCRARVGDAQHTIAR